MIKKTGLLLLVVLMLLPFTVFAAGGREAAPAPVLQLTGEKYVPAQKVTLEFWHSFTGDREKLFVSFVDEFMQENPQIEIKLTYGGNLHLMREKLMTAIAGGAAPDIAEIDSFWTPLFAESGSLYNLLPFIDAYKYDVNDLFPASKDSIMFKGNYYSIPFNLSNIVLYYNKAKFAEVGLDPNRGPQTWDELVEFGKKLTLDKNGNGAIDQWGLAMPLRAHFGAVWYWLAFFWQQNGELFNPALTEARFNSPAGVAAAEFWRDLVWKHKILSLDTGFADFQVGNAAMGYGSTTSYGGFQRALGAENVGVVTAPKGITQATVSGGGNLAILSSAKDPKAAWEFLNFLGTTEINTRWCLATGAFPYRRSVMEVPEYKAFYDADPLLKLMLDGLETTIVRPNIYQYSDASQIIAEAVEEIVFENRANVQTILDRAKREVDRLF